MKIVYFGNNMFSSCLKFLIDEGHQILKVYKNNDSGSSSVIEKLCDYEIPCSDLEPELSELAELISLGAEMFIVAEYSYLLPETNVKYAINLHPTLLPNGRGPTPLPYLIKSPEFSGITIHKLSAKFDSGDILLQSKIAQSIDESLTTLMIKMYLESVKLLKMLFEDIDKYYRTATSQTDSLYWPRIDAKERILDWKLSNVELRERIKCFGHIGLLVKLNNELWRASHIEVIDYRHDLQLGHVVFEDKSLIAVSYLDGIACIHKASLSLEA